MRSSPSATNQKADQEIIDVLSDLARFKAKYPEELFVATRVAFLVRVDELSIERDFSSEWQLTPTLE